MFFFFCYDAQCLMVLCLLFRLRPPVRWQFNRILYGKVNTWSKFISFGIVFFAVFCNESFLPFYPETNWPEKLMECKWSWRSLRSNWPKRRTLGSTCKNGNEWICEKMPHRSQQMPSTIWESIRFFLVKLRTIELELKRKLTFNGPKEPKND